MFINLNPGTVGLDGVDFDVLVEAAPKHGFEGIDLPIRRLETTDQAKEAAAQVADAGLRWGLVPLPRDFLRAEDAEFESGLAELEARLPVIEAAGCCRAYNHIWPGSDERSPDENLAWHVDRLGRLSGLLGKAGVMLGIEFIGPRTVQQRFRHPFIRTATEAAALADAAGPNVGLVVDLFHWYTSGESLMSLSRAVSGRRVVNVHANDARTGLGRDEQQDLEREMPLATGVIDAPAVMRLLADAGYDGPVISEPFSPAKGRLGAMAPEAALAEVGASMRALFAAAGMDRR